jgi:hypothetical protein
MNSVRMDLVSPMLARSEDDGQGWECCPRLTKSQAEMLLDWLEANGYRHREVCYEKDGGFTVRWRK